MANRFSQPPEMWELLRHPRWRTNYTCLQEAADRTRPKMDPSKVWTLRMQNKAAAAREAQKKDDDAAGLGCGTGELQRADLQAEERRQQQADKRQKAEEARANQERQVVLMEGQMDALELAAETSERTFKKTVQEVLNAYSRIDGKARNPSKDAEMTAEIQMIRAVTSKMSQGEDLREKIGLIFTYGNAQLIVEAKEAKPIVRKTDIGRYMQQYTLDNDNGVRVTMLSHTTAKGEVVPQAAIVDIKQPQVALAQYLRRNTEMMIGGVCWDVSVRSEKDNWVHLRPDDARASETLRTIVAKWIAAGLTDADIENMLLANVHASLPEWKARIAAVYIDDTRRLGKPGEVSTFQRLLPKNIGWPNPDAPRMMIVLGNEIDAQHFLADCSLLTVTIRLLGGMATSLDTRPAAHMTLGAMAAGADTKNETLEQVEAEMAAAAQEAIQKLQEQWEEDERALETAEDAGIADEQLTQMITDIISVLAAAQAWAPRALAQAISQLHEPDMSPQAWATLIRNSGSACMQAMQGVKWRTVTVTGVPLAGNIAGKDRSRTTWLTNQCIKTNILPQGVKQMVVGKGAGKRSTPGPADKFVICLEDRQFQNLISKETGPLTFGPQAKAGTGQWRKESLDQNAAKSGKTTDLTVKWVAVQGGGWQNLDDKLLKEKVLDLLAQGHGIWVPSKSTNGTATQDTGENCTTFADLPLDKSKEWLVQNVWQRLNASAEQQSLDVLGGLRQEGLCVALHCEKIQHHVYVHKQIRQSVGPKEMHDALQHARSGEGIQAEIIAELDTSFQFALLQQIDKGGAWTEGKDLGTTAGTAEGDNEAALPLENGNFWPEIMADHYYAALAQVHHGRRAIQEMTSMGILAAMVKGGHTLLIRASSEYGLALIGLGRADGIQPGLPVPFAQIQPDEASMAMALTTLRQNAVARGSWIMILTKPGSSGTNILREANANQSAPENAPWKDNTLQGLAPESDLNRHGLSSLLIGINKWIEGNTAKAVAVDKVGILLVLTTDAWLKVYGQRAFGISAQRELAVAAQQGKISEKLQDLAADWLTEEIEAALAQKLPMFLHGARWEHNKAENQDTVGMIPGVVLVDPIHQHDMRRYVKSPSLYVNEGENSRSAFGESLSAPARQVVERWEYKLNLTNGILLLSSEHELCIAIDGMDNQDTVLKVEGNTLSADDIKYIRTQIGPSYNNRAAGGDDDRMLETNKREAEESSDTTKKQRPSHTPK